jgi:CRISPR-associated endonuclease/helicase Cas3
MSFATDFERLTGKAPLPWQEALFQRFMTGHIPRACDLPTGLGKTMVIVIWLLALVSNPKLPRRLVYVVNRRTVVDQSTTIAEEVANRLQQAEASHLRDALRALAAIPIPAAESPLAISTLRGQHADNADWRRDPARPSVIVGTVDMIGSRLLFSGYGLGFKSRPLHAGFLGQDALVVHDEAHLEPAFQMLLEAIADEQKRTPHPRPLRVMSLSATGRTEPDFTLGPDDLKNGIVRERISARKGIRLHSVADKKELAERAAQLANELEGKVLVFLSRVEDVERCAQALRKEKKRVQVLTGTMRGNERDGLTADTIFGAFLSPAPPDAATGTVYLVATSAGEVGIDISADHLVSDLPSFDSLAQRLGRVNRYGNGDALVELIAEPLKDRPKPEKPSAEDEEDEEKETEEPKRSKDELEWARAATRVLLSDLPLRGDDRREASPTALRRLPAEARSTASSPQPEVRAVDGILFDRWSYTSFPKSLPGRPPVEEWLHGVAEWEPPRTTVAWRNEVSWLTQEHLGDESLDDFLSDYPLRARETLSDRTDRVAKHLEKLVTRDEALNCWLIKDGEGAFWSLKELLEEHDPKANPLLSHATVVLEPAAGGLSGGLLDGAAGFDPELPYDLGSRELERHALEVAGDDEEPAPPDMRLVRAIRVTPTRTEGEEGQDRWWKLYTVWRTADDEGSRTSREQQTLTDHLSRTERWAGAIAKALNLPLAQQRAVALAGKWHDLGKKRRVWQRSIKNFDPEPLAKGKMQPSELGHYRHELGSIHDACQQPGFSELAGEERDLALHLIAAHHGRARPHFPIEESFDPELKDADVAEIVKEVPLRFNRLQQKHGRWGLAWLESLLRAADWLASDDDQVLP